MRKRNRSFQGPPVWWDAPGPRVLIETPDLASAWAYDKILRSAGCATLVCEGPGTIAGGCPLVRTGRCDAVGKADAVVFALPLSNAENRAVMDALLAHHPGTPICAEVMRIERERWPDLASGCAIERPFIDQAALKETARRAAARHAEKSAVAE